MKTTLWTRFRRFLAGARLTRAIERNEHAANELDRLIREVLGE